MPDVFTKAKRSDVMSRIRSRGNKDTELALAKLLRRHRIAGWRRQQIIQTNAQRPTPNVERSKLCVGRWKFSRPFAVRPDFVFPKLRVALFVDGCFWHGCPKHATKPRNNAAFWRRKFARNLERDRLVTRTLRKNGWCVLRIWEHELARKNEAWLLRKLRRRLAAGKR
jgi:DNA mismatch endonuclease (patch repair protein)